MTDYWPTAREPVTDTGSIGVVRHRPHRIIRHKRDDHARRIVTALAVGALATGIVSTVATGVAARAGGEPAASMVGDPAPVGVEPEHAENAARLPQSADPAAVEGSATPEGVEPTGGESRASQVAANNARADRIERPSSAPAPSSATSVPPSASTAASPQPSITPDPSGSSGEEPSPSATPDPSSSTSDGGVSPSTVAPDTPEPSVTGSESVTTSTRHYGTCVPRVDRSSRSSVTASTRASGNHLHSCGVARRR